MLIAAADPATRAAIVAIVSELGHPLTLVATGGDVIAATETGLPLMIVLDDRLPDVGGVELARELRGAGMHAPIVLLSDATGAEDEVAAFAAGADEYVRKPFDTDVLRLRLARVVDRGAFRRLAAVLRVGELVLDRLAGRAEYKGVPLPLTTLEFKLLHALTLHVGRAVSLDVLADVVWGHPEVAASNTYRVHVQRLRRKLEAVGCTLRIHTIRGEGYVLAARLGGALRLGGEPEAPSDETFR